jgi:hypothetical protein
MATKKDPDIELHSVVGTPEFPSYVEAHPHVLIPSGFDEVRMGHLPPLAEMLRRGFTSPEAMSKFDFDALPPELHLPRPAAFFRKASSGAWHIIWLFQPGRSDRTGLSLDTLGVFHGKLDGWRIILKPLGATKDAIYSAETDVCLTDNSVLSAYDAAIQTPGPGAVVLPKLFRHPHDYPRIELVESTRALLDALQRAKIGFPDLTWQQAEDMVAELLRAQGLQVSATPRAKDGGRDLIARGELIPGEPCLLAVEIKHKAVVGIDEVTSRIHRNKDFPALLFVTTGTFTAGVVREKSKPENFLRLLLKDRTALHQWIRAYRI